MSNSRDVELEEHAPVDAGERRLENPDLTHPRVSLRRFHGKSALRGQRPEDRFRRLSNEVGHTGGVISGGDRKCRHLGG
jgi:hypothetical protein